MPYLELNRLRKSYGKGSIRAVDDVSLRIEKGEFVVLVGSSGCGKSTTLRLVAGLEAPDAGTVSLNGCDVTRKEPADRNVAMVFQDYALYPHMTVFDNIAFPLKVKKLARAELVAKVHAVAALLDIEDILDRKPPKLSGGQKQRVAIGRALVRDPSIFLMDEPLSNLDAKLRAQMRTELANLHRTTGATILYVTHDQTEAMTLATKIVVMDKGCIQQIGTPSELYFEPRSLFVATFIGSPQMNLLECRVRRGKLYCGNTWFDAPEQPRWPAHCEGRRLFAGFRSEHVSIEARRSAPPQDSGGSGDGTVLLDGVFEREEIIGSDVFLIAETCGQRVVGKAAMSELGRFHAQQPVAVSFDLTSMLLFDASSGERVEGFR